MNTILILYHIALPESSHQGLVEYLKTAPQWARPATNTWIIKTITPVNNIRDGVKERIGANDKALVIDITGKNWGTFNVSKEVTEWMKQNV